MDGFLIFLLFVGLALTLVYIWKGHRDMRESEARRRHAEERYAQLRITTDAARAAAWEESRRQIIAANQAAASKELAARSAPRAPPVVAAGFDGAVYREAQRPAMPMPFYNAMTDQWEDRTGNAVPDPRDKTRRIHESAWVGASDLMDPRKVGARISTINYAEEDEHAMRRRHAVEQAMVDAQINGIGVMRVSDLGVEHVPARTWHGGGGTFDGGGASSDYGTSSASSCSDSGSSSSSSPDSGGSCSSGD